MRIVTVFIIVFTFAACSGREPAYKSPSGYDLNHPKVYKMPESLLEISGIAFHDGRSDTLYAEQDEEGAVFMLQFGNGLVGKSSFKKHGDFEDIAICNDEVIMLRSDGKLYSFPIRKVLEGKITKYKEWKDILPDGEYEGMYADNSENKVYVLCKNCKVDKDKKKVSGYIFQLSPGNKLSPAGGFQINSEEIAKITGKNRANFKPSALAKNKRTKEWYILSSENKMLVVANEHWDVKQVYNLNPDIYIQPEGIAFDKDNNLYISSEGSKTKRGRVMKIPYKPK